MIPGEPEMKDNGMAQETHALRDPILSVVLCTHDPRPDHLRRTLDALRRQTLPCDQWELVIVDNASREPLSDAWELSWHPNARFERELQLGLTPARIRGIRETRGDLVVFVDDDNELDQRYLETVLMLARQRPDLGCFGSARIIPEFEEPPASDLEPYTRVLALRDEADGWSKDPQDWYYPWGAGMVVRRAIARAYVEEVTASELKMQLDRRGTALNSCGDDEFSWIATRLGSQRGIFRSLEVKHLIGARRVRKEYLLALHESFGYSRALLFHSHGIAVARPEAMDQGMGHQMRMWFHHLKAGRVRTGLRAMVAYVTGDKPRTLKEEFDRARSAGLVRFYRTHILAKGGHAA